MTNVEAQRRWLAKPGNLEKARKASREWERRHRHEWHAKQIWRKHRMTMQEYDLRMEMQAGLCAICRKPWDGKLHVDHDHETGANRGLLCGHCNRGLGLFREDLELFKTAAEYLKQWGK